MFYYLKKIILEIGSEVDVILKSFSMYLDNDFHTGNFYEKLMCVSKNYNTILKQYIEVLSIDEKIQPFTNLNNTLGNNWWKIYNKVKHERNNMIVIGKEKKKAINLLI